MTFWIAPLLLLLYVPKALVFFVLAFFYKKVRSCSDDELPSVSVLIPARDEASNIASCLDSLLVLDYPKEKLEILVGNDQSGDNTAEIVTEKAISNQHVKLINIESGHQNLIARSNVLAQLAKQASGEYFVFLDADMKAHQGWLKHMVYPARQGYDLVSGYTKVGGERWLDKMQQLDWYNVLAWLKAAADLGKPGTALGNNMLVSRSAYEDFGGYEKIGPTFTEDNDLTLALRARGHKLYQVATVHHAVTQPAQSMAELISQRNRWMQGALRQPILKLIPVLISRLFVLAALLVSPFSFEGAGAILGFNIGLDLFIAFQMSVRSGVKTNFLYALLAPVFNSVLDTFTLLSYPWNKQVVWKGRKL